MKLRPEAAGSTDIEEDESEQPMLLECGSAAPRVSSPCDAVDYDPSEVNVTCPDLSSWAYLLAYDLLPTSGDIGSTDGKLHTTDMGMALQQR